VTALTAQALCAHLLCANFASKKDHDDYVNTPDRHNRTAATLADIHGFFGSRH
jgi:hypothetical protein